MLNERTKMLSGLDPINIGEPINSPANEFYPSVANNNNFYFTCDERSTKGKDDIFFS